MTKLILYAGVTAERRLLTNVSLGPSGASDFQRKSCYHQSSGDTVGH